MDPDRRPVAYATSAWLVAAGFLVAIVALNTSPPPEILGEPAGEPQGAIDEPDQATPIEPSGSTPDPAARNATVPRDTTYTFNGSIRSSAAGSGERIYRLSTMAADGTTIVSVTYSDQAPTNSTTFPGQKTNVQYELFRNGTLIASGSASPAVWGDGARIAGSVDGGRADWEVRLSYEWPSDFDYTLDVKVNYPR